jgi:hypothetical protein
MKEGEHVESLGVDESNILKCILEVESKGTDWINVVQYRDNWQAVVNKVMNFQVS